MIQITVRKCASIRAEQCVQCGACIVQCPFDALYFQSPDGDVITPDTVRQFKLNLLGSRQATSPKGGAQCGKEPMQFKCFVFTLVIELLLAGSLLFSIARPYSRVWPPPGFRCWQFWWVWSLTIISLLGTFVVAILDWDSFVLNHWARFIVGGVLFIAGTTFALWGLATLSLRTSLGLRGEMVTSGPYPFSRNPQYFGDFGVLSGIAIISNSLLSSILCGIGIVCFYLAPFAEEPWLVQQYGKLYDAMAA